MSLFSSTYREKQRQKEASCYCEISLEQIKNEKKRRLLKGKQNLILQDIADDTAKCLKAFKGKQSVESAWFTNGRINTNSMKNP